MDVLSAIKNRRSFYTAQMSGEIVEDSIVWELLNCANWAPNHYHTEPWRFRVFAGKGLENLLDNLAELYKKTSGENFSEAKYDKYATRKKQLSHAIAIVLHKSDKPGLPAVEEREAVACAVQNLWLATTKFDGVGGYWSTGNLVYLPEFAQFLNLESNQECLGIFYLGMIKADGVAPQSSRGDIKEKVIWTNE
ncbi:MAG: nitroreductase [Flavobacteriales bacterium]|nr:nitroreductase [Flavobacteriales bacterium]